MTLVKYRTAIKTLVQYLCFTMLTGCTTLRMEIVDPTDPVKLVTPLVNSFGLQVDLKYGGQSAFDNEHNRRVIGPGFAHDFVNGMKQTIVSSGAALNVQPEDKCAPGQHERTLCITTTIFNNTWSFAEIIKVSAIFALSALLLFIPLFFMAHEFRDWVVAETVLLDKAGQEIARFKVQSKFIAHGGMGRGPHSLIPYYSANNKELANRIVLELKRHPHWFESAPLPTP